MLEQLEEETGLHLPPGHNPDLRMMTHLWDDLPHLYRPLAFYLFMEGVAGLTAAMLAAAGFERHTLKGHTYYTLHLGRAAAERPILFLHGVGAGHFPYITFVAKLAAQGERVVMIAVHGVRVEQLLGHCKQRASPTAGQPLGV